MYYPCYFRRFHEVNHPAISPLWKAPNERSSMSSWHASKKASVSSQAGFRFWEVTGRVDFLNFCGKPNVKPYEETSWKMALWGCVKWKIIAHWGYSYIHENSWSIFCFVVSSHMFTSFTADMNPNARWTKRWNTSCDASGWFLDPPESTKKHMPSEWIMGGFGHFIKFAKWVCLKMLCTPNPDGFADHYPVFKWLFHWEYTQHFQTNPNWRRP